MKTMKNFALGITFLSALLVGGCGALDNGAKEELEKMKLENARLAEELGGRDQQFSDIMSDFNEIENNLLTIQNKEKSIAASNPENAETQGDAKARIEAEIQSINDLMDANKKQI